MEKYGKDHLRGDAKPGELSIEKIGVIYKIRQSLGDSGKAMLSDLPGMVAELRRRAEQAETQRHRVAGAIRDVASELRDIADAMSHYDDPDLIRELNNLASRIDQAIGHGGDRCDAGNPDPGVVPDREGWWLLRSKSEAMRGMHHHGVPGHWEARWFTFQDGRVGWFYREGEFRTVEDMDEHMEFGGYLGTVPEGVKHGGA